MNSKAYKSYKISKNEYCELKYFCLRYSKMKQEIQSNGGSLVYGPIGGYTISNKRIEQFERDVKLIDRALELSTDNEIVRGYLRRSVTENVRFESLDVPMGRRQFYELRRKFFYILCGLKMGYEVQ